MTSKWASRSQQHREKEHMGLCVRVCWDGTSERIFYNGSLSGFLMGPKPSATNSWWAMRRAGRRHYMLWSRQAGVVKCRPHHRMHVPSKLCVLLLVPIGPFTLALFAFLCCARGLRPSRPTQNPCTAVLWLYLERYVFVACKHKLKP